MRLLSTCEILAQIKLNVASVEQFLAVACSLADDNPAIRDGVYEAAKEVRSSAVLVDHLRSLFSHQSAVEGHQSHLTSQQQQQHLGYPSGQQHQEASRDNLNLFSYSNQVTLIRAAKSLVANVAKILYLTDSIVSLQQQQQQQFDQPTTTCTTASGQLDSTGQYHFNISKATKMISERLDNIANYSQLLRSFNELSLELVDLAHCVLLARCAPTCAPARAHWPLSDYLEATQAGRQVNWQQQQAKLRPEMSAQVRQLDALISDMQTLFQVNRLIIDRSILLLLSASKCCLRPAEGALLPPPAALEARKATGDQIRVSLSVIMAIIKCSVFSGAHSPSELAARPLCVPPHPQDGPSFDLLADWTSQAERPLQQQQPEGATSELVNYFLRSFSGSASARDSIINLKLLVEPFKRIASQSDLADALDVSFGCSHRKGPTSPLMGAKQTDQEEHEQQQLQNENKENLQHQIGANIDHLQHYKQTPNVLQHQQQLDQTNNNNEQIKCNLSPNNNGQQQQQRQQPLQAQTTPVLLMDKRQLVRALNATFLGALKSNLIERLHEFTDCAYTKHEHRQTLLALLGCIKFQLHRFVKLIYRLRRRSSPSANELELLGQLRQLAVQLVDTCAELDYELQIVVVEQSDELDRANNELELVKQVKHFALVGDKTKGDQVNGQFYEQAEQLIEVCKQLNQVAPTNKLKLTTKTLAIWFDLNLSHLLASAECLCDNPRSRTAKDFAWAYLQVWCSFYDDFCQLARQVAYLAHANYDLQRAIRVNNYRELIQARQNNHNLDELAACWASGGQIDAATPTLSELGCSASGAGGSCDDGQVEKGSPIDNNKANGEHNGRLLRSIGSVQSLNNMMILTSSSSMSMSMNAPITVGGVPGGERAFCGGGGGGSGGEPLTESPRSLDHYHGFGLNYRRAHELASGQHHHHEDNHHHQAIIDRRRPFDEYQAHHSHHLAGSNYPPGCQANVNSSANSSASSSSCLAGPNYDNSIGRRWRELEASDQLADEAETPPTGALSACPLARPAGQHFSSSSLSPLITPLADSNAMIVPPTVPARRGLALKPVEPVNSVLSEARQQLGHQQPGHQQDHQHHLQQLQPARGHLSVSTMKHQHQQLDDVGEESEVTEMPATKTTSSNNNNLATNTDQQSSSATDQDKWSDSEADAIVRGARETAQMALSMYQFTRGEGDLNTTQDLFTQAELFAEEANELYKEVRCFSYKVPAGDLKKELLNQLGTIPALVQQLQFIVKNPTVGKAATFSKVDSVIRETKSLMEAVNRVVEATLSCRQHYNMAIASMRKRTRTLSPSYRNDKGFEFESFQSNSSRHQTAFGSRHSGGAGGSMGSEPDI